MSKKILVIVVICFSVFFLASDILHSHKLPGNVQFDLPVFTLIKGGDFVMGDHYGYVDPQHPSDELPMHTVHVDSIYMGTYIITNQQYCDYLNSALSQGLIQVVNNVVKAIGDITKDKNLRVLMVCSLDFQLVITSQPGIVILQKTVSGSQRKQNGNIQGGEDNILLTIFSPGETIQ